MSSDTANFEEFSSVQSENFLEILPPIWVNLKISYDQLVWFCIHNLATNSAVVADHFNTHSQMNS